MDVPDCDRRDTRRAFLRRVGTVGIVGAAGCGGSTDETGETATPVDTTSETATSTPRPTETPQATSTNTHTATTQQTETIDTPEHAWAMYSHNFRNSGHNEESFGPADSVEVRWQFETDSAVRSSPAVVRGTVYIGSDDGNVYALDAKTGEENWIYETGGAVKSSPGVLGQTVYVGSNDGNVHAIDVESGEAVWTFETGGKVQSPPTVEAGPQPPYRDSETLDGTKDVVAVGSNDGGIYVFDAETGEKLKVLWTDGPVVAAPYIVHTKNNHWEVGAGSTSGSVHIWVPTSDKVPTNEIPGETPIYAPISIPWLPNENIWFRALDDGTLARRAVPSMDLWSFEADGSIRTTPVIGEELIYVGSRDGSLYAVDAKSGDLEWSFETGGKVDSSPAVADGTVYVGSADQSVYAFDGETGKRLWAFETGGEVVSSPAVVEGTVYIGSNDSTVYALSPP